MNRRLSKKINRKTIDIFLEWLSNVLPEEEQKKLNRKEYKQYVPESAYYWSKFTRLNSMFTPRWIKRKLKLGLKRNPIKPIEDYCLEDLK